MELDLINAFTQLRYTALAAIILLPGVAVALFLLKAWMDTPANRRR